MALRLLRILSCLVFLGKPSVCSKYMPLGSRRPLILVTSADVESFAEECPQTTQRLTAECHSNSFSCAQRCGTIMSEGQNEFSRGTPFLCSCDALCQVYRDCCWDFSMLCPYEELDKADAWNSLHGAEVACETQYTTISSCLNTSGLDWDVDRAEDHREPIVSEKGTGLHFQNRTIYSCYEKSLNLSSAVRWEKQIVASNFTGSLPGIREYLLTGKVAEGIKGGIHDVPLPGAVSGRPCHQFFEVDCRGDTNCTLFKDMSVSNFTRVCELLNVLNVMSPSDSNAFGWTCSVVGNNEKGNVRKPYPEFSFLFDVKPSLGPSIVGVSVPDSWYKISCMEGILKPSHTNCTPEIKCQTGMIFLKEECLPPQELRVTTESQTNVSADEILQRIQRVLDDDMVPITVSLYNKVMYETERSGQGLNSLFRVEEYRIEHSGGQLLDIATILINALNDQEENLTFSSSDNASVCIIITEYIYMCGDILVNGVLLDRNPVLTNPNSFSMAGKRCDPVTLLFYSSSFLLIYFLQEQ